MYISGKHNFVALGLFTAACVVSVFVRSDLFSDIWFTGKWYGFLSCVSVWLIAIGLYRMFRKECIDCTFCLKAFLLLLLLTAVAESVYALIHMPVSGMRVIGSFDNEAGLVVCICASLPFTGLLWGEKNCWPKLLAIVSGILLSATIIISKSRTGIFALTVLVGIVLLGKLPWKRQYKWLVLAGLLSISVGALYILRPDSANGRLLIWRCSWEMIKEKLLFGWGINGFRAHYMDYQRDWLSPCPHSQWADLAGDTSSAFNSIVGIAVRFGIAGLFALAIGLWHLLRRFSRVKTEPMCWMAMLSLVAIGACSLFSYPFTYPYTWLVLLTDIVIIVFPVNPSWPSIARTRRWLTMFSFLCGIVLASYLAVVIPAQISWHQLQCESPFYNEEAAFGQYKKLEKVLGRNPFFLYNFAAELSAAERYEDCLEVAMKCRNRWSEYDLEVMIGDCCEHLKQYEMACEYYESASHMCPCRFLPLYRAMLLYEKTGQVDLCRQMAAEIIDKTAKIPSPSVSMMKAKAQQLLTAPAD